MRLSCTECTNAKLFERLILRAWKMLVPQALILTLDKQKQSLSLAGAALIGLREVEEKAFELCSARHELFGSLTNFIFTGSSFKFDTTQSNRREEMD